MSFFISIFVIIISETAFSLSFACSSLVNVKVILQKTASDEDFPSNHSPSLNSHVLLDLCGLTAGSNGAFMIWLNTYLHRDPYRLLWHLFFGDTSVSLSFIYLFFLFAERCFQVQHNNLPAMNWRYWWEYSLSQRKWVFVEGALASCSGLTLATSISLCFLKMCLLI